MAAEALLVDASAAEGALARHRAYSALSELILGRIWRSLVTTVAEAARAGDVGSEPDLAAGHTQLFCLEVPPYAGLFLDRSGLAGSAPADVAHTFFLRIGFEGPRTQETADHFGVQLAFLSRCAGLEYTALHSGDAAGARELGVVQRQFYDDCVLPWLIPFTAAVADAHVPFWTPAVELAAELIAAHRNSLGAKPLSLAADTASKSPLHEQASIRSIAEHLCLPTQSGLWLGRRQIATLSQSHDIPRGFGQRLQMLINLLRNAAQYDRVDAVLSDLLELTADTDRAYQALADRLNVTASASPWLARLAQTRALVAEMATQLAES